MAEAVQASRERLGGAAPATELAVFRMHASPAPPQRDTETVFEARAVRSKLAEHVAQAGLIPAPIPPPPPPPPPPPMARVWMMQSHSPLQLHAPTPAPTPGHADREGPGPGRGARVWCGGVTETRQAPHTPDSMRTLNGLQHRLRTRMARARAPVRGRDGTSALTPPGGGWCRCRSQGVCVRDMRGVSCCRRPRGWRCRRTRARSLSSVGQPSECSR